MAHLELTYIGASQDDDKIRRILSTWIIETWYNLASAYDTFYEIKQSILFKNLNMFWLDCYQPLFKKEPWKRKKINYFLKSSVFVSNTPQAHLVFSEIKLDPIDISIRLHRDGGCCVDYPRMVIEENGQPVACGLFEPLTITQYIEHELYKYFDPIDDESLQEVFDRKHNIGVPITKTYQSPKTVKLMGRLWNGEDDGWR